jgi:F-type H+-transporting ATPase subunit delta
LLDVALDHADAPALRRDLEAVVEALQGHAELRSLLGHPAVSPEAKKKVVDAVFAGHDPLLLRLLRLLIDRGRIESLPAIVRAYVAALQAFKGVVPVEAVSASALDAAEIAALAGALESVSGGAVEITQTVDPAVLGGVLVRMQGRTYDGSVRARLRNLRLRLAGA